MRILSNLFVYRSKFVKQSVQYRIQAPKSISSFEKWSKAMAPPAKKIKKEDGSEAAAVAQSSQTSKPSAKSEFVALFEEERKKTAKSILDFKFAKSRVRILNKQSEVKSNSNGILYWIFRDQRVQDNWAFLFAQKLALKNEVPLHVCYCILPKFLDANTRHYNFLIKGLQEIEEECTKLNISFHLFSDNGGVEVPKFVRKHSIGAVVIDFCPLRVPMQWVENLKKDVPSDIPVIQVDAHNIVPVWVTSDKQEYAARTIRNKIVSKLSDYLTEFPPVIKHPYKSELKNVSKPDWKNCMNHCKIPELEEIKWATPGYKGGIKQLEIFCLKRLRIYATQRNDPTKSALSDLSPWFHFGKHNFYVHNFNIELTLAFVIATDHFCFLCIFRNAGQISPQRCALQVRKYKSQFKEGVEAFLEESIVRRELSDNFCFFNENYDNLKGCADWARKSLNEHRKDKREWLYTVQELEEAKTHDDLWNSAQIQLRKEGKMHGFLRMYWAKKILEWTESPEAALKVK